MTSNDLSPILEVPCEAFGEFLAHLGYNLTVVARSAYKTEGEAGSLDQLMGFNELQHQIYGRCTALGLGHESTTSSFIDGLLEKARFYKIEGELGWALRNAINHNKPVAGTNGQISLESE